MRRIVLLRVLIVLLVSFGLGRPLWGAAQGTPAAGTPAVERSGPRDVILATTTSTADTGLLDELGPLFEQQTGYHLKPIAVGSGAALKLGQEGEADVVLAHSPQAEETFMAGGYGTERRTVMVNDQLVHRVGHRDGGHPQHCQRAGGLHDHRPWDLSGPAGAARPGGPR